MFINEMEKDSKIELEVKAKGHSVPFLVTMIRPSDKETRKYGKCIHCTPVLLNNKIVNLGNYSIMATIHNDGDGRIYKYPIAATTIDKKAKSLILHSPKDAKPENFRRSFRVPCSYKVVLQIGNNRKAIQCTTHDISYSGAAYLLANESAQMEVGSPISASIYDHKDHIYKAKGKIVRIVEDFSPDITLIGVEFSSDTALQTLVAQAQINELKIRHRKDR